MFMFNLLKRKFSNFTVKKMNFSFITNGFYPSPLSCVNKSNLSGGFKSMQAQTTQ